MASFAMMMVALAPGAEQRLGSAVCSIEVDRTSLTLADELSLTLRIEGPAPVEVELPQPFTRSKDWRLRALPPKVSPLPNGRERWEQVVRAEAFQSGERVPLTFEPIRFRTGNELRDWTLTWPATDIQVQSSADEPDLGQARPVTGLEPLPTSESNRVPWLGLAALGVVLALLGVVARRSRARRAARDAHPPHLRAEAEIDAALAGPPADAPMKLAQALRDYCETRFAIAATRQTTTEFVLAMEKSRNLPDESLAALQAILVRCDVAKFAGAAVAPETLVGIAQESREWIQRVADLTRDE